VLKGPHPRTFYRSHHCTQFPTPIWTKWV
jgi:hypothetical protein